MERIGCFLALAFSIFGSPSAAEVRVHLESGEAARIDLDVSEADTAALLEQVADLLHRRLDSDGQPLGNVSVRLQNVTVETALRAICESVGCRVELGAEPGAPMVVRGIAGAVPRGPAAESADDARLRQPITVSLRDAALADVLNSFGRIADAEVDLPSEIGGSVTMELDHVAAAEVLDALCRQHGLRWRLVEVRSNEAARRRLEIRRSGN